MDKRYFGIRADMVDENNMTNNFVHRVKNCSYQNWDEWRIICNLRKLITTTNNLISEIETPICFNRPTASKPYVCI